jgi:hypothetical protein
MWLAGEVHIPNMPSDGVAHIAEPAKTPSLSIFYIFIDKTIY